jgi:hypothetical protein
VSRYKHIPNFGFITYQSSENEEESLITENGRGEAEIGPEEVAGSLPEFGYGMYDPDAPSADANGALLIGAEAKPRILLMGLRRLL